MEGRPKAALHPRVCASFLGPKKPNAYWTRLALSAAVAYASNGKARKTTLYPAAVAVAERIGLRAVSGEDRLRNAVRSDPVPELGVEDRVVQAGSPRCHWSQRRFVIR